MEPFRKHRGVVVTLDRANVDTDQIIPKQFLKRIERTGFGKYLFYDRRYLKDGSDNPDFELNRPEARGATILISRRNFGSGSSREHAVWALADFGFRAVIAPSFAAPQTTSKNSRPFFSMNATRSPIPTPAARSAWATRLERSSS